MSKLRNTLIALTGLALVAPLAHAKVSASEAARLKTDLTPFGAVRAGNKDGSIPKDNPFVDQAGAMKSIYSYGHRNPQGLVLHPETGQLWEHEHGPRGGDEVNIIEKGKNMALLLG